MTSPVDQESRTQGASPSPLVLREFDWSGLVKGGFFQGQMAGVVSTIVGLAVLPNLGLPDWVLVDARVSVACLLLNFVRIWKTNREEYETMALWDNASRSSDEANYLDRVFEIPYVLSILALPITTALPQLFMATLALFYLIDNYYNSALARLASGSGDKERDEAARPNYGSILLKALAGTIWLRTADLGDGAHSPGAAYFRTRFDYNRLFVVVLVATAFVVGWLEVVGQPTLAWVAAVVALGAILMAEWFVEPMRNRGVKFEPEPEEQD